MASMLKVKIVLWCFACFLVEFCLLDKFHVHTLPVKTTAKSAANPNVNRVVVTIQDGKIEGKKHATVGKNKTYYLFRGIPFATPPIGELRFQPPAQNSKWNGTLDATQDKSECVQNAVPVTGSEDCLYINVYTPNLSKKKQPVMVWIYGDGFSTGNSSYESYGPDYLLDEDVIFVSFNYRLGIFGFISTEDLFSPGNLGLKDQVLALKWVQRNIEYFGGDPAKITIFGQSAGAASVGYLLQAKEAKGLYKAAILESGSSLCLWAVNRRAREKAFAIGATLGILTSNSTELIDGLRKIDFKVLQDVATTISTFETFKNPLDGLMFGPVKEPYHDDAITTIFNNSEQMLSRGDFQQVPTLAGFNSNEGASMNHMPGIIRDYLLQHNTVPTELVPADLTFEKTRIIGAGSYIREHYFGILPLAEQPDAVMKFISDDQFYRPIRRMVLDMSKYVSVYFYKFSYEGVLGGVVNRTLTGVGHAEELGYIFRTNKQYNATQISKEDIRMRQRMVKLWTNFAKYNNPTPTKDKLFQNITWLPAKLQDSLNYLDINTDMKLLTDPFQKDMTFWDNIYEEYGEKPYDTY